MPHVVLVIPGIMGSVLMLGDDVIWPGPVKSLIFPYKLMPQLMEPRLRATDCIRRYVQPVYESLLNDLEVCQFKESAGTLVVVPYDWRKSIEEAADGLAAKLAEVVAKWGDKVEISLVAHSMGGLVCRYLLEAGKHDAAPGHQNVARLITIGTPHRGAAVALPLVLGQEKRLFLSADQVLQLASSTVFPGPYQLLPRPGEPVIWDGAANPPKGGPLGILDFYDPAVAASVDLVPKNLAAAVSFHAALNAGKRPAHVRYFCFAGNRQETATYVMGQPRLNGLRRVAKVEQDNGGDATVPIWSSTLPGVQFLYVSGEHGSLFTADEVRWALGILLGRPGYLAAGAANEISLHSPVVEPKTRVQARLKLSAEATELKGEVRLDRLEVEADGTISAVKADARMPVSYRGPVIEFFSIAFDAPANHGHYRVSFHDDFTGKDTASVELIVQLP